MSKKTLLIISHTPHYRSSGNIVGWGPTVREIDYLSSLFKNVIHLAPLHEEPPTDAALPYRSSNIDFVPVQPAGGPHLWNKLGILLKYPGYALKIIGQLKSCDLIHIRCPANISLMATLLVKFLQPRKRIWIKYAGNWQGGEDECWSYKFQRMLLKQPSRGLVVTVNGEWPDQEKHVRTFSNPCLSSEDISNAYLRTRDKQLKSPIKLIYVGRIEEQKGAPRAIEILDQLTKWGISATLDLAGDGNERASFEALAEHKGISSRVRFHGWVGRDKLNALYTESHFIILPTKYEGWPKVLSEAMAHGVVPLTSTISSIPQYIEKFQTGRAFDPYDVESYAEAVVWYLDNCEQWKMESEKAREAAESSTYSRYLENVSDIMKDYN
jgi:glycosyltransferase involved in cell wall biosynthesis